MNNSDGSTDSPTWTMVDVSVHLNDVEVVSDAMWMLGVVAIEEIPSHNGYVILRTSMGEDPSDFISALRQSFPSAQFHNVHIERSVADTWREFAEPTFVTESIAIVPAWLQAPSGMRPIFIEPFDTFGLGNHPTTVLALQLAVKHIPRNSTVFDLGSGSGVLSVAVDALLGCSVMSYDIADSARDALHANMTLNSVTSCQWIQGYPSTPVGAVLANILAPVLKEESSNISHCLAVGGVLILSGMRTEQVDDVLHFFPHCAERDRITQDGWTAVALERV